MMCYEEGMVMSNLGDIVWVRQWEWVLMVFVLVGLRRDIHW